MLNTSELEGAPRIQTATDSAKREYPVVEVTGDLRGRRERAPLEPKEAQE